MIEVKNIKKYYGPTLAVNNISFFVQEGEIVGLLGPNGAGKTTLMRILTTFIYPSKGTAVIGGFDVIDKPQEVRRIIGYLPETPPLYMDMRVDEYIDFVGRSRGLSGKTLKERLEWAAETIKITGVLKHNISELSLGYRQRVGLAQALVHDPKVIILDEPTSGLDPMQIIEIRNLIKSLAKNKTIIFSTHILQEASAVANRLVVIDKGKIIANGTLAELKQEISHEFLFQINIQGNNQEIQRHLREIPVIKDCTVVEETNNGIKLTCKTATSSYFEAVKAVNEMVKAQGWILKELSPKEISLEEIFLRLFKKAQQ